MLNKLLSLSVFTLFTLFTLAVSWTSYAEVIHSERSLYRNILVEDGGDLRCLKFDERHSKTNQSCMYKSQPEKLVFNYTKLLFSGLLMIDDPKRILIVGLGGGTMSNTLHELYPEAYIDNVEIDPAVIKVAREYFGFFENERIKTHVEDGRIFVKRAKLRKESYDWIILDAFNGDYIPEHLLTVEFLEEVKSLLSEDGVLTSNTFSISELYAHESATYQAVFDEFYNVSNDRNGNRIIVAKRKTKEPAEKITARANALEKRLERYDVDINDIHDSMSHTSEKRNWPADTKVLTDQYSPANLLKNK